MKAGKGIVKDMRIQNRHGGTLAIFIALPVLLGFLAGFVVAWNSGQPTVMGHSLGELNWSFPIPGNLYVTNDVGVGVTGAGATDEVTVDGTIRTIPRSSASCSSSNEGAFYYDSDNNYVYICRNGAWYRYPGATGSTGPQGPRGPSGPSTKSFAVCVSIKEPSDPSRDCDCGASGMLYRVKAPCTVTSDGGSCWSTCWSGGGPCGSCCVCKPS
jgi:hypothetical protein